MPDLYAFVRRHFEVIRAVLSDNPVWDFLRVYD